MADRLCKLADQPLRSPSEAFPSVTVTPSPGMVGTAYVGCTPPGDSEGGLMEQVKKTPIGEMRLVAPGVIVHRLTEGVSVTEADATLVKQATEELAGGEPVVIIVDMRRVAFANRDARDVFKEGAGGVEIGTALLTDKGFSKQLAGLFMRFTGPTRPVELFHDEADAIAWAESLLSG